MESTFLPEGIASSSMFSLEHAHSAEGAESCMDYVQDTCNWTAFYLRHVGSLERGSKGEREDGNGFSVKDMHL